MKNGLKVLVLLVALFCFKGTSTGQVSVATSQAAKKIKVYLLGTFHFSQTDDSYDVRSEKHQKVGTVERYDGLINEDSLMNNSTLLDYMRWINSDSVMNFCIKIASKP